MAIPTSNNFPETLDVQTVGDSNAAITDRKRQVLLTATLTASRTYTLPAANKYVAGDSIVFADTIGSISLALPVILQRNDGPTTLTIVKPYAVVRLVSDGSLKWAIATENKLSECWNAVTMMIYNGGFTTPVNTSYSTLFGVQASDAANTRLQMPINPTKWAGRSVKIGVVVMVNGTSAGNIALRFALAYRNTALGGSTTTQYNVGSGDDGAVDSGITGLAAPTAAGANLLIQSSSIAVPNNITAATIFVGFERTNGADTNTNTAYIMEIRMDEQ